MAEPETIETTFRPANDAYTGMLAISFLALVAGCVFLFLDFSQYPDAKAPKVPDKAPPIEKPVAPPPPPKVDPMPMPMPMPDDMKKDDEKKDDEKKAP